MPIEFRCPACQKLLRVPDESSGAKAKCPDCGAIADIPPQGFADSGGQEWTQPDQSAASDSANPYSSPAGISKPIPGKVTFSDKVVPTRVDAGSVISYAWEVWKSNLGILLGITVLVFVVNIGFSIVQSVTQEVLTQQGNPEVGAVFGAIVAIFSNLVQIFLGIGQAQIILKLVRGQRAEFGELFGGGSLLLRVLGASILAGIALLAGVLACVIPAILLLLFFWPFYYLIVDRKATAIESFGMARPIAQENVGTVIVLWLASIGIVLVGFLALCVGVLFAAPLVNTMWGTAYLMMSGQISREPQI